jgi:hypothetical protein
MGYGKPGNGKTKVTDEMTENPDEEIDAWCESFKDSDEEMTEADRDVSEWCRLQSPDAEKGKKDK